MNKIYIPLLAIIALITFGCSESTSPITDGRLMTLQEIRVHTGFIWFDQEYNQYQPDSNLINELKNKFDEEHYKIYFFVKPACSCELAQESFPYLMKVLHSAGIKEECAVIYAMSSSKSPFPESEIFSITKLPSIFLVKDMQPIESITDKIEEFRRNTPDGVVQVENLLLQALNQ